MINFTGPLNGTPNEKLEAYIVFKVLSDSVRVLTPTNVCRGSTQRRSDYPHPVGAQIVSLPVESHILKAMS